MLASNSYSQLPNLLRRLIDVILVQHELGHLSFVVFDESESNSITITARLISCFMTFFTRSLPWERGRLARTRAQSARL